MALKRLAFTRGKTQNYGVTFKQSDGTPYNIKNWTVYFTMKTDPDLSDDQASLQKTITSFDDCTSGTSGSMNILIEPADTVNLEPGTYDFDISVVMSDGANREIMKGKVDLDYNVTRTIGTAGTYA